MSDWSLNSRIYGDAWSTPELRAIFSDQPRTAQWLQILAVLAEVQAAHGLIPADEAECVAAACRDIQVDDSFLDEIAEGYKRTGHSTVGLIEAVRERCPGSSGEWFYYGATVQDLTDTWLMGALTSALTHFETDIDALSSALEKHAQTHRDTVMAGRTHGQQGLPITFGFKAAGWLAEADRHRERLKAIAPRIAVGQLCGGVGSLSSLGPDALKIQADFCKRLGLRAPVASWTVSRDRLAEWGQLLTLIAATADRIGHEIYNLQRSELAEVTEGFVAGTVGSITMPHKRNPEIAEHLGSLSRVVRANAQVVSESLVHDHERDGRSWKSEWHAIPELTMVAGKALNLLVNMVQGLRIDAERMRANLDISKGYTLSEAVMLALSKHIGKQSAHTLVYETAMRAHEQGTPLKQAIESEAAITKHLSSRDIDELFDYANHTGACGPLVDQILKARGS